MFRILLGIFIYIKLGCNIKFFCRVSQTQIVMALNCVCVCGVRFVVHGLTPGESYVFRVQAANMFGLSEESQESSPIAVEPSLGEQTSHFIFCLFVL